MLQPAEMVLVIHRTAEACFRRNLQDPADASKLAHSTISRTSIPRERGRDVALLDDGPPGDEHLEGVKDHELGKTCTQREALATLNDARLPAFPKIAVKRTVPMPRIAAAQYVNAFSITSTPHTFSIPRLRSHGRRRATTLDTTSPTRRRSSLDCPPARSGSPSRCPRSAGS